MNEVIIDLQPIWILAAAGLTVAASFAALEMFILVRNSKKSNWLLFLGGTVTMGIGIWIMDFISLIANHVNYFSQYQFSMVVLSVFIGITFTGMAFFSMIGKTARIWELMISSLLLTLAVISIHMIGALAVNMVISYRIILIIFTAVLLFAVFLFTLWFLFCFKNSVKQSSWLKPLAAFMISCAIVEGHWLLNRAIVPKVPDSLAGSSAGIQSFYIYPILFVSILILAGLIGSSTLISSKLSASDSRLEDVITALNQSSIVAITDEMGTIISVNEKFCEISKYSREELIGSTHSILNSGYHSKEFFRELWKTILSGHIWKGEICNRAKDGSLYWVDTTIVPFLNKKGRPYQYVSIRTDITDRKKAEVKLQETLRENNDIKFALDQSSIVAFTDANGLITSVNDKFCEISKYKRSELIGKTHRIVNSGYHSKEFFEDMWETIINGKVWKGEIRNKAKDGSLYWVDTTIVPFMDEQGKPYQYLAIRNDITERKETEETLHRQDKLATVGKMAAGVAHEIRNPLTSMKGYTEFLLLDEKDPQRHEFLEIILDEIDRVNMIVEDFLVLAKPKAVELNEKNLIKVIQDVISLYEMEARKKNVRLHFSSEREFIQINCDENRLKQVFLNFVKNGVEAMPNGGDLWVNTVVEGENVHISIRDTGIGIPPEKLSKLGEPFFTTKKNGNGLGLMVSFNIIESHHGKVYVESELNKGTTINILLPAKTA